MDQGCGRPLDIAVIGQGIAGMSAAWLLSHGHRVTVYEAEDRLGGHSHTVDAGPTPVDMGFIVYNEVNYPNLVQLFRYLGVPTRRSEMSFAVSLDDGALEYGANTLPSLFAQPSNLVSARFWSMLRDIRRFYRHAPGHACALGERTLGDYLGAQGYGPAFQEDHLLPQAAAIWSVSCAAIRDYPAEAFIRFCENHGLLKVFGRPVWRTVVGGSREYVARLTARYADHVRMGSAVRRVQRTGAGVIVTDADGLSNRFDQVVIAAQKHLWSLQGEGGVWFCGAYFGSGFHEDGLQAGLAVAEALGGVRRPWRVENESGRIHLGEASGGRAAMERAA